MSPIRVLLLCALATDVVTSAGAQVLLIPDSGADKVWAFSPFDGSLLNPDFIPNHPSLAQPINAVDSGNNTILVSDEVNDSILEFDYNGAFIGTFAGAASGIDGPFGLTVFGGQVYVASTVNTRVVRYDAGGANPTVWASGFGTPRDIAFRGADALITESVGDDIVRFDHSGAFQNIWHNSDGVSGIDFPQQLQLEPGDGALVAGFTAPFGLYTYDSSGVQTNAYTNLITSPRGVYRLGNGNLLYAGGTRVMVYDPNTLTESTIVNQTGASFRFIEFSNAPAPGAIAIFVLAGAVTSRRRRPR